MKGFYGQRDRKRFEEKWLNFGNLRMIFRFRMQNLGTSQGGFRGVGVGGVRGGTNGDDLYFYIWQQPATQALRFFPNLSFFFL